VLSRARWGIADKTVIAALVEMAAARIGAAARDHSGMVESIEAIRASRAL